MEHIFKSHPLSEYIKVQVAATGFCEHALYWWCLLKTKRRRNGEYPVETWAEMKAVMRERFIPSHHQRELNQKLRCSSQPSYEARSSDARPSYNRFKDLSKACINSANLHKVVQVKKSKQSFVEARPKDLFINSTEATTRDMKCFKCQGRGHYAKECPSKQNVVPLDNGEIMTNEEEETDTGPVFDKYEEDAAEDELMVASEQSNAKQHEQQEICKDQLIPNSENEEATKETLILSEFGSKDDSAKTLTRRYPSLSLHDSYTLDFKFVEEVDFVFWRFRIFKTSKQSSEIAGLGYEANQRETEASLLAKQNRADLGNPRNEKQTRRSHSKRYKYPSESTKGSNIFHVNQGESTILTSTLPNPRLYSFEDESFSRGRG
ncbi:hypothetical protein EUTSA_v10002848mg [Eutrema salsugineum]|uniref:CCHC-type domain-containing protein n=1 Tax=Eutrema salsugineum TaxID=72664 RepID=V4L3M3_EUTSA|nr:hypothetical protein EUTSA_v10002848mg [Eutrema salsugineum]